jgi:DNA-binding MarR family transcriptional regulator
MALDRGLECEKLFRLFARWVGDHLDGQPLSAAGDLAITAAQFRCLEFLAGQERCSIGDISDGLIISDPASTKLVDRLERKGLVGRQQSADDRRVVYVRLNESGRTLVGRVSSERAMRARAVLAEVSADKLDLLAELLASLLESVLDSREVIARVCLRCGNGHASQCVVSRAHAILTGGEGSWP